MLYKLRSYQNSGLEMLKQAFRNKYTRPLYQCATGSGKTVTMAHIVSGALDKGKRVLFVAPYTALINQTAKSFMAQGLPKPGIIQADHPWTDSSRRLQIASVQTLIRRKFQDFDLILVDECHLLFKTFLSHIDKSNTPVIGFTATPWSKGIGKHYDTLLKPISMTELIDQNFLSEYIAYAPVSPDMDGVRIVKGDYHESETAERMSTPKIVGSITETWMKKAENLPTICFAQNVAHANFIGSEFDKLGISNHVITSKTPIDEREQYFKLFSELKISILINVGTLIAGLDLDVRCIILACRTKSEIKLVQMLGRGLRTADGKEYLIILDHSGTMIELGYPDEIDYDELDTDEKKEVSPAKAKEKYEKLPKKCQSCDYLKPAGEHECSKCGFKPRKTKDVEVLAGELVQMKGKKTKVDKQQLWSELVGYKIAQQFIGRHISDGWMSHTYRDITGVWPRGLRDDMSCEPSEATLGFIKYKQIAYAKSLEKKNAAC